MTFSNEWEETYRGGTHLSIWPWSDLVSYVMRYAKPKAGGRTKVLELGCGAGANIPFFLNFGSDVEYFGVDGSPHIIEMLKNKYPSLRNNLATLDFTKESFQTRQLDIIVDRGSLTHNTTDAIRKTISEIRVSLKNSEKFIGIDWFSTEHSDYNKGENIQDEYTKSNIKDGQFKGVGNVHFSTFPHLKNLFEGFDLEIVEHKIIERILPDTHRFAAWLFVAKKT